jgi:DNA-binding MarR family transcriptional regulator
MKGYEILDYLYEKGPRTVEEIADYTGLSHSRVTGRLLAFMPQEYIEKVADLYFFA